jgi:hypothetical protein
MNILFVLFYINNFNYKLKRLIYYGLLFISSILITYRTIGLYEYDDFFNHIKLFESEKYADFIFVNPFDFISLNYLYVLKILSYDEKFFLFIFYFFTTCFVTFKLRKSIYKEIIVFIFISPTFIEYFFQFPRQNIAMLYFIISLSSRNKILNNIFIIFTHFYGILLLLGNFISKKFEIKRISVFYFLLFLILPYFFSNYFLTFFINISPFFGFNQILTDKINFFITFSDSNSASITNFKSYIVIIAILLFFYLFKPKPQSIKFINNDNLAFTILFIVTISQLGSNLMAFVLRVGLFSIIFSPLLIENLNSQKNKKIVLTGLSFLNLLVLYQSICSKPDSFEHMYYFVFSPFYK